jgi:CBS domain containing-hemolysin-like protein
MPDDASNRAGDPPRNLPIPVPRLSAADFREGNSWIARVVRAMFGWKPASIRADLETALGGPPAGDTDFTLTERTLLKNILGLREQRIEDVMVPRADIVAVPHEVALGELLKVFESAGHSRLVVYQEALDDPVGIVHIRDLVTFMIKQAAVSTTGRRKKPPAGLDFKAVDLAMPLSSTNIVRSLLFVPPSMPAVDLLAKMQASHMHLALVIDEYGGTDGLVSMEDLVEEVVGEIEDEHDEAGGLTVLRQPDGSFLADGRAQIEDVVAVVGKDFDIGDAASDVDTLGGYVVTLIGRVPVRGELIRGPDSLEFQILDADPRRIKKIRIYRSAAARAEREERRRDGDGNRAGAPTAASSGEAPTAESAREVAPTAPADEVAPPASADEAPKKAAETAGDRIHDTASTKDAPGP